MPIWVNIQAMNTVMRLHCVVRWGVYCVWDGARERMNEERERERFAAKDCILETAYNGWEQPLISMIDSIGVYLLCAKNYVMTPCFFLFFRWCRIVCMHDVAIVQFAWRFCAADIAEELYCVYASRKVLCVYDYGVLSLFLSPFFSSWNLFFFFHFFFRHKISAK